MTRRQIREHVLRLIFNLSFRNGEKDEQVQLYFEQVPDEAIENPPLFASPEEKEYIAQKARAVAEHFPQIDELLNQAARGWTTSRMGKTDLAILRLAVYEMRYDDQIPVGVAINEAVELAKQYGEDTSASFINGILAKLANEEG